MDQSQILSRIEHNLLSMQMDDIEPLFILYADTVRDIEGVDLNGVLHALLNLVNMGFSKCMILEDENWHACENLTLKDLENRFKDQSETERKQYPTHVPEYYFEITQEGKKEEGKAIYNIYYKE